MKSPNACCISELLLPDTLPPVTAQKSHVGWEVPLLRAARRGRLGASWYVCGQQHEAAGHQVSASKLVASSFLQVQLTRSGSWVTAVVGSTRGRGGKVQALFSKLPLRTSLWLCHWSKQATWPIPGSKREWTREAGHSEATTWGREYNRPVTSGSLKGISEECKQDYLIKRVCTELLLCSSALLVFHVLGIWRRARENVHRATFTRKGGRKLVALLCLTLCEPTDCGPPGSSVHGILQARILEWVAISFFSGSFLPRDWTCISCIACNAGDPSSISGLGRSTGEGIGFPLQYSWASLMA